MTEAVRCPRCSRALPDGWKYHVGFEMDDLRSFPPKFGRGGYCEHISPSGAKVMDSDSARAGFVRVMEQNEYRPGCGTGPAMVIGFALLAWAVIGYLA